MAVFGGFLLGPLASHRVSLFFAPDSELVQTASLFAFVLVFVGGTLIWMGFGIAAVVVRALVSLVRGRLPQPATSSSRKRLVPPGYHSYVILGAVLGATVGALAALVTDLGALKAIGVWGGLGIGYGLCLSLAAHHGYLPFAEPE